MDVTKSWEIEKSIAEKLGAPEFTREINIKIVTGENPVVTFVTYRSHEQVAGSLGLSLDKPSPVLK
jgi:hypothetical protein